MGEASKADLVELGKAIGDGIAKGMPIAADKEPNSFIMLCAVIALVVAAIILCVVILKYAIDSKKEEQRRQAEREERDERRESARDALDSTRANACHMAHREVVDKAAEAIRQSTVAVEVSNRTADRCIVALDNNTRMVEKCMGMLSQGSVGHP